MKKFGKDKNPLKNHRINHSAKSGQPRPLAPAPRLSRFLQKNCKKRVPALRFRKKALRSNLMLSEERQSEFQR
jgi:hypothetical protein